jgi:hypothetical protein
MSGASSNRFMICGNRRRGRIVPHQRRRARPPEARAGLSEDTAEACRVLRRGNRAVVRDRSSREGNSVHSPSIFNVPRPNSSAALPPAWQFILAASWIASFASGNGGGLPYNLPDKVGPRQLNTRMTVPALLCCPGPRRCGRPS